MNIKDIHWDWLARSFIMALAVAVAVALVIGAVVWIFYTFGQLAPAILWGGIAILGMFSALWAKFYNDLP